MRLAKLWIGITVLLLTVSMFSVSYIIVDKYRNNYLVSEKGLVDIKETVKELKNKMEF